MTEPNVTYEKRGHLATIQLNRPKALNALNAEMLHQLKEALDKAFSDAEVASIWLESAFPAAFSAGGDVKAVVSAVQSARSDEEKRRLASQYFEFEYQVDLLIEKSPKPVVAYATGVTFGGGWGLFAGANLRLASESAKFSMPEVQIGLFPDVGAASFLTKHNSKVGRFLAISGMTLSAQEALALDFIDDIVAPSYAEELKAQLAKGLQLVDLDLQSAIDSSALVDEWTNALSLIPDEALLGDWMNIIGEESNALFARAAQGWRTASMWSVVLSWHHFLRMQGKSREAVLAIDAVVALNACVHPEFSEGVRAKLIDKDHQPSWLFEHVESVPINAVEAMFKTP